jgi:tetratricopeptide (TPR) repeat protein
LRTVQPILSPVVWTSAATGKTPDKHGIFDFLATAPDGSPVPVTRTLWRARPVWDVLGDAGVEVAVTAWWATWPAEPVRGFLATDRIAYQLFDEVIDPDDDSAVGKTWPPGLWDDVRDRIVRPADVPDADLERYVDTSALDPDDDDRERLESLRTIVASTRTYEAIATDLLERRPSGFHAVYHEATDTVAHLFMPYHPPPARGVDARRAVAFAGAVDAAYREADAMLGRLLARIDDGWNVVVLSDHGFKHGDNRPATESRTDRAAAADWHDRFGILVLHGPGVVPGTRIEDASILDVAPTLLALYGLPVPGDLDGRVLREALDRAALADPAVADIATFELPGEDGGGVAIASEADAAMIERLRSLGYIGGGGDAATGPDGTASYAQEGARALQNQGIALLARGDREGAMKAFRAALDVGGGAGSLVNIARLQLATRDVAAARKTLASLARGAPGFPQLPALRGWLADLEGDAGAARRHLEEALAIDPADSRTLARLGHLDERAGDLEAALVRYRAAVRADPENAQAHTYLGNVLRLQGRTQAAEAAYRAAVEADPRAPGGTNNLGLMLQASGRVEEAIALYRRGLEYVPGSALLHNSLAAALVQAGDLVAAEQEARRAVDLAPDLSEARVNLGIALAAGGRPEEAIEVFETATTIDADNPDAWFNLARARLLTGDREGAHAAFARASDLEPDGFEPAVGAAEVALALGRTNVARRYFERAAAIRPDSQRVRARLDELGGGGPP